MRMVTQPRRSVVAFALREKTWKLGCTTGHGQKPRERSMPARDHERVLDEIAQAKRRVGRPETAPVVSGYEAGRAGFWLLAFCEPKDDQPWGGSSSLEGNRAGVEPRAMVWTSASCAAC